MRFGLLEKIYIKARGGDSLFFFPRRGRGAQSIPGKKSLQNREKKVEYIHCCGGADESRRGRMHIMNRGKQAMKLPFKY